MNAQLIALANKVVARGRGFNRSERNFGVRWGQVKVSFSINGSLFLEIGQIHHPGEVGTKLLVLYESGNLGGLDSLYNIDLRELVQAAYYKAKGELHWSHSHSWVH